MSSARLTGQRIVRVTIQAAMMYIRIYSRPLNYTFQLREREETGKKRGKKRETKVGGKKKGKKRKRRTTSSPSSKFDNLLTTRRNKVYIRSDKILQDLQRNNFEKKLFEIGISRFKTLRVTYFRVRNFPFPRTFNFSSLSFFFFFFFLFVF